jgi:hypothetical protein
MKSLHKIGFFSFIRRARKMEEILVVVIIGISLFAGYLTWEDKKK